MPATRQQLDTLLEWACENGTKIHSEVNFEIGINGVGAYFNNKSGGEVVIQEPLISVPESIMITPKLVTDYFATTAEGKKLINKVSSVELFKLFLSKFKDGESQEEIGIKFKPFFKILPSAKDLNIPFFWKEKETALLQNTDAEFFLQNSLTLLYEGWVKISRILGGDPKQEFSLDEWYKWTENDSGDWLDFPSYVWASCILSSRGFPSILIEPGVKEERLILVPIMDLTNHVNDAQVKWIPKFENHTKFIDFNALDKFPSGKQEIYNNYGSKDNLTLLFGYGFIDENNKYGKTTISMQLDLNSVNKAISLGVAIPDKPLQTFEISHEQPINEVFLDMMQANLKLDYEISFKTHRTKLEAIEQMLSIYEVKLNQMKQKDDFKKVNNATVIKTIKGYKKCQRLLIQKSYDELNRLLKSSLKESKAVLFKKIYANDGEFSRLVENFYQFANLEESKHQDYYDYIVILYILLSKEGWIKQKLGQMRKIIGEITPADEMREIYQNKMKIPQIAKEITIDEWFIADKVYDVMVYTKVSNGETYLINN
ncbi:SET domain-containing protein [Hyphopichia burtonii NRRL Y-1933]|uniref:SET domain-containing protein n=1 Tax=Hyphopichia burtonii NRRL Y-1933 TaxID=984485 RepID=A0A1E4RGV0_9ASCO|nr:SET domain-containing protein [Hyphopichia burtonii NRRL Y-1933]ODV66436.1 SET domain-containing protein [Hyphopichia burtonii NRRL Y-1933]